MAEVQDKTKAVEETPNKPVIDESLGFIEAVMKQKDIDHHASHSNLINQWLHLISSSMFLYCYAIFFKDCENAMYIGLASLIIRQSGHYVFEPPCHEKEQAMLGFDTENKVKICLTYGFIPAIILAQIAFNTDIEISLAQAWLVVTFSVVFGRVALLWYRYNFVVSMHWFVKFVTDPFTDIPAYWKSGYQIVNPTLLQGALHESFPEWVPRPESYVKPLSGYDKAKEE